MKLFHDEVQRSERLAQEYATFEEKHRSKLERDIAANDEAILKAKEEFERGRLLQSKNILELAKNLEYGQIRRNQLTQIHVDAKEKIARELRAITVPAILGFSEELIAEFKRVDGKKSFSTLEDKENIHSERGGRICKIESNYFSIHRVEREILDAVEKIKAMDCQSLVAIRGVYDAAILSIPERFETEVNEGTGELLQWFNDNRPREINPAEGQTIWMHHVQYLADLDSKVKDWKIGEFFKKHKGPIEIDMTGK